jgi:hypothetical protein
MLFLTALDDSPWLGRDLDEFVHKCSTEAGKIYRFTGTFTSNDERSVFAGELTEMGLIAFSAPQEVLVST